MHQNSAVKSTSVNKAKVTQDKPMQKPYIVDWCVYVCMYVCMYMYVSVCERKKVHK